MPVCRRGLGSLDLGRKIAALPGLAGKRIASGVYLEKNGR